MKTREKKEKERSVEGYICKLFAWTQKDVVLC
jgi:hypothetical protein